MPIYRFTAPDGKVYRVTAPEGASETEAFSQLQKSIGQGQESQKPKAEDKSTIAQIGKGVLRGVADIGNTALKLPVLKQAGQAAYELAGGTGQREESLQQFDDENKGGAYTVGRIAGNVAGTGGVGGLLAKGAAAIPRLAQFAPALASGGMRADVGGALANTATRAGAGAVVGGASAAMVNPSEVGEGAAIGAVAPFAIQAAVRGGQGLGGAARAIINPWTGVNGQQAAASDVLKYLGIPGAKVTPDASGALPTLAEVLAKRGMPTEAEKAGRMLDSLATDPELGPIIAQRLRDNNAARLDALKGAGGDVEAARQARSAATKPLYQSAFNNSPNFAQTEPKALADLLSLPGIAREKPRAVDVLLNKGRDMENNPSLVELMHEMQIGLRTRAENLRKPGSAASDESAAMGLENARTQMLKRMGEISPEYDLARNLYRQESLPVNQAQIADEIYNRAKGAMSEVSGEPRLMASKVLNAVADENALVKAATGRKEMGDFGKNMTPNTLAKIKEILQEIDRSASVGRAAVGSNSATARRAVTTNVLHQLLGPLGVSRRATESAFAQTPLRPFAWATSIPEDKVREQMTRMLLGDTQINQRAALNLNPLEDFLRPFAVPLSIQE
jgi:hypothetical protein